MRQKRFALGIVTIFAVWLTTILPSMTALAVDTSNANRMNVVFVMDESGSMARTDPESLRYDAMDLFLGLATESGNYMGAVAFDEDVILRQDIAPIEGLADKTNLSQSVRRVSSQGDTNIGKAIETATQMLQESGNASLPSAVILLSDGNTDLGGNETKLQESYASRDNAIDAARANGYKIYSVCLNTNGDADPAELQEISAATGGTSVEVKSAEDLKEVFSQFYNIIYSTETIVLGDMQIPDSGEVEIPFRIPRIGVEEANIIISTLNPNTSYMLYRPDGIAFTESELNDMKITAKTFSVLKVQDPQDGEWKLIVRGNPGDNIKIEMVYNSDLDIAQAFNDDNPVFGDSDVLISAQISNMGNLITDESIYQDYPLHVVLADAASGTPVLDEEMSANNQRAEYTYHLPLGAAYDVYCYCQIDNLTITSDTARLEADRPLPVSAEDPVEIRKTISPFTKAEYTFDLGSVITDSVDPSLTYSITESDIDGSKVSVEGENLKIRIKEIGKGGSLSLTAANSAGGSITVAVNITTFNILPLLLIILAAVVLLIVLLIVLKGVREGSKPIKGRVMITPYTEDGTESTTSCDGVKGKMMLARCMDLRVNTGMDLKTTYFVHGEKDSYIYLVSKNGYYTDIDPDAKNKKIRLDAEMEVDVSSDIDFTRGIRVTYIPDDMDY